MGGSLEVAQCRRTTWAGLVAPAPAGSFFPARPQTPTSSRQFLPPNRDTTPLTPTSSRQYFRASIAQSDSPLPHHTSTPPARCRRYNRSPLPQIHRPPNHQLPYEEPREYQKYDRESHLFNHEPPRHAPRSAGFQPAVSCPIVAPPSSQPFPTRP